MEQGGPCRLFILGAGASVDSGMRTYRNAPNAYYTGIEQVMSAESLESNDGMEAMWKHIDELKHDAHAAIVGKTYERIESLINDTSIIITQNVDGIIHKVNTRGAPVYELHGTLQGATCLKCKTSTKIVPPDYHCVACQDAWLRPNVILFGESVPAQTSHQIFTWIKKHCPLECYVIGTSLQFPYLHKIINACRRGNGREGCRVIHVNTDPEYVWHLKREKTRFREGQAFTVLINRKTPDVLKYEL